MIEYICDKQVEVRQAASFGIGVMAQFGGDNYSTSLTGKAMTNKLLDSHPHRPLNILATSCEIVSSNFSTR